MWEYTRKTIEDATKQIIDLMVDTLSQNGRVEVRGFGSFSLHHREPRGATLKQARKLPWKQQRYPILNLAKHCEAVNHHR